jgi:hypothetical protein
LRWLWNEGNEELKPWVGLGGPHNSKDKKLFAVATKVTMEMEI